MNWILLNSGRRPKEGQKVAVLIHGDRPNQSWYEAYYRGDDEDKFYLQAMEDVYNSSELYAFAEVTLPQMS